MVALLFVLVRRTATARYAVLVLLVPVQHRCMIDFSLAILKGDSVRVKTTRDPIGTELVPMKCSTIGYNLNFFHGVFSCIVLRYCSTFYIVYASSVCIVFSRRIDSSLLSLVVLLGCSIRVRMRRTCNSVL